jgi:hypothetical protein
VSHLFLRTLSSASSPLSSQIYISTSVLLFTHLHFCTSSPSPCSQQLASCSLSSATWIQLPPSNSIYLTSILILSFHPQSTLCSSLINQTFVFPFFTMRATCAAHPIFLDSIILMTRVSELHTSLYYVIKGKAIPLQALTGPEGSRWLRSPDFMTIGTWRWQGCQPCAPAAFTPRKHS